MPALSFFAFRAAPESRISCAFLAADVGSHATPAPQLRLAPGQVTIGLE